MYIQDVHVCHVIDDFNEYQFHRYDIVNDYD